MNKDFRFKDTCSDTVATLIERALAIQKHAHAIYSSFKVGAALLGDDDTIHIGVNIENASYGLGICAERNAIFSAVTQGMCYVKALAVVGETEEVISPCGACRQIIAEFSKEDTVIILANTSGIYKLYTVEDILPFAFTLAPPHT